MNNFPDIRTLTMLNFLSIFILSLLMLYILKKHETYPGFKMFTAAAFINSTGFIFLGLRHGIPLFISVIAGNSLIALSTFMILWAIHKFCSENKSKKADLIILSVFIFLLMYFTYIKSSISTRIILMSILFAYLGIKISYYSRKELNKAFNISYLPLSGSALIMALTHIVRAGYYLFTNIEEFNFMHSGIINAVILAVNFSVILLMYTSFIVLNGYRSKLELKESEKNISTLEGLLPICSHCHKIRDDKGYWEKIELYMQKYSEIQFSHGLCPDCLKKHYPDYKKDERKPQSK